MATTSQATSPPSVVPASRAANSNNQLTSTGYSYDGNGNPTSYSSSSLSFDPENRMTGFGSQMTATYGADGLRASRTDETVSPNNTVFYLYDGDNPIVQLVGNSGGTQGQVSLVNCFGANGLIGRHFSGSQDSKFYAFDPQGSVAQRVANDGSVDASFAFDAFGGRSVSTSGTIGANDSYCGFGGQWGYWYDAMTGLELCTHRYYDPGNGRFVTRDPTGYGGGIGLYCYTRNNPAISDDADGYSSIGISSKCKDTVNIMRAIHDICTTRIPLMTCAKAKQCAVNSCNQNIYIKCSTADDPYCRQTKYGACSYASENNRDVITLCPGYERCGCLASTILWEMINNCGHSPGKDSRYDLCGCAEQPFKPGTPPCTSGK